MKYYLLKKPDTFNGEMDVVNFHRKVDYRQFTKDQMYRMPSRITCRIRHRERREYPLILLEPLPLFHETAWKTLQVFMKKPLHTEFLFQEEVTGEIYHYVCPAFHRIRGKVTFLGRRGEKEEAGLQPEEAFPEGLPALYVENGDKIYVLMSLDILESLMRKDLCDIRLLPVQIMEG